MNKMARQHWMKPKRLYPAVLRGIANLIEARRVKEVNLAALEEIVEYVKEKQKQPCGTVQYVER